MIDRLVCLSLCLAILLAGSPARAEDAAPDTRQPFAATAQERTFILEQMRLFVISVQAVTEGLASGDKAKAAAAAAARGRRANADDPKLPKTLKPKLPAAWKQFIGAARDGFDALADSAKSGEPTEKSLGILAATMRNCVACHQSYRLAPAAP